MFEVALACASHRPTWSAAQNRSSSMVSAAGLFDVHLQWTEFLRGVVDRLEPQGRTASIWGTDETASSASAALVIVTMIQGYELDDTNPASIHSCAAVLPAAIAAVELIGPNKVEGETLLTAVVAGFEVGPASGCA